MLTKFCYSICYRAFRSESSFVRNLSEAFSSNKAILNAAICRSVSTSVDPEQTTPRPLKRNKTKRSHEAENFIDWLEVRVAAGQGGDGMCSFLSLPMTEYAGPDGGDGGNGGHVIFEADTNLNSLNHLRLNIAAKAGEKGRSKNCNGRNADHLIVKVPVGTFFRDTNGTILTELKQNEAKFLAARGGAGGKGNAFFLSNEVRAPVVREVGGMGEVKKLTVEMRVIAHAGLVGFPNAGKSTLLSALSRARPKVASYPFTTLHAHVGIIEYEDRTSLAIADLPGIIPDAHKNRGLGLEFLRHIERCVCLMYVIDLSQPEPWLQLEHLRYELDMYSPGLADRPCAIVGNKIDLPEAQANLSELQSRVDLPVFPISAKKGINVTSLLIHFRKLYDEHHKDITTENVEKDSEQSNDNKVIL
ncbi:mitochondrial ribosome-associated GTPase 2-like [Paramacrobiotus metropolitanus]|uniref:mitochondrial ribosome-associated GTPase 2-like n=1 Tax=Paramacrobiotus metropolitanus TaxID=2943436 RepID=UPI002445AFE1|nr:mitochondrial ribosome-associated GTPase 2-like [Paramacrobiotus metropolitanus]